MSKAAELAALIGSQTALSNRNLIINGAMQVAQRGTSEQITTSSGGYFTCDRWRYSQFNGYSADIDATMSQETDTPNNTFKNSFKFLVGTGATAAAADAIVIEQIIEAQDIVQLAQGTSDAKKFTVSFWVKASIAGTYCISLHSGKSFGSNRSHVKEYTISSANTWEYIAVTVDGDTSGTWAEDNGAGLSVGFSLGVGSTYQGAADTWSDSDYFATSNQTQLTETTNATWQVTGVQLEVGETATPFEHRSYGDELASCQRYYQQFDYTDEYGSILIPTINSSTGQVRGTFTFITEMRAAPTFTSNGAGNFRINDNANDEVASAVGIQYATKQQTAINFDKTTSNLTIGNISYVNTQATNDASMRFDAEL